MSAVPGDTELPLVVHRWSRHGHDRAYVKAGDEDLGYRDLKTGDVVCPQVERVGIVARATEQMYARAAEKRAAQADAPPSSRSEPDAGRAPAPARLPDRDLALNRAGQSAREQSQILLAQAPVRLRIARLIGVRTDERNWHVGAVGEERTGDRLTHLGPQWHVLHAVPVGDRGSDIDHVVIGPGGVFTVNAKNRPQAAVWVRGDTVKVNGSNQPYVRNSRHEARRAAKLLSAAALFDVEVHALIAVMGAHRGFTVKQQPADGTVTVVGSRDLVRYLEQRPAVLGTPSVERIYAVARHLATWQPRSVGWSDF